MLNNISVIKNDTDVRDLSPASDAMLATVIERYSLKPEVSLFETLHGHIALMEKKAGHFIPGNETKPARMHIEDFIFLQELPGFRWIEATNKEIKIGFHNQ